MARLDVLHSAVEDAPADGLLDKLREVAFFHARGAEISAQRKVDFPGDLDIPANSSSIRHLYTQTDKHLYAYIRAKLRRREDLPVEIGRKGRFKRLPRDQRV